MEIAAGQEGCGLVQRRNNGKERTGYRGASCEDRPAHRRERFFRESARSHRRSERKSMIDRAHDLPLAQQARLLDLSRSSLYYRKRPVSEHDVMLMNLIDRLHTEWPFAGARMLRDMLRADGHDVGRRHM